MPPPKNQKQKQSKQSKSKSKTNNVRSSSTATTTTTTSTTTTNLPSSSHIPVPLSDPPHLIPEFFLITFRHLFTPTLPELIQRVKHYLYERDYAAAFGSQENLEAYVVRWSAARAIAYRDMVVGGWWGDKVRDMFRSRERLSIVSIGGGAGAEVVGFAAARRDLGGYGVQGEGGEAGNSAGDSSELAAATQALQKSSISDKESTIAAPVVHSEAAAPSKNLHISCVDVADWSPIVTTLTSSICNNNNNNDTNTPSKHSLNLPESAFSTSMQRADILHATATTTTTNSSITNSLETADIITILFTAGELYSQSPTLATKFLLSLTARIKIGTILVIVDSAGGFENLDIRKDQKKMDSTTTTTTTTTTSGSSTSDLAFKLGFILDRTLESQGHWSKVVSEDARWWRVPEELLLQDKDRKTERKGFKYPLPLENARCLVRVYERIEQ